MIWVRGWRGRFCKQYRWHRLDDSSPLETIFRMFRWNISVLFDLWMQGKTYGLMAALDIQRLHFPFNTGEFSMECRELQYTCCLFLRNWKMQRWPREQRTFLRGCSMRTLHPQSKCCIKVRCQVLFQREKGKHCVWFGKIWCF